MKKLFILLLLTVSVSLYARDISDAMAEYRGGNYDKAISVCSRLIEKNPKDIDARVVMGWSLIKQKKYQEAHDVSLQVLEQTEDSRALETAGRACFYLWKNRSALEYFNRYVKADPEGKYIDDVYSLMGDVYMRLKEYNNADIAYSAAVHYYASSPRWWYKLGHARELAGSRAAALKAYDRALALNPSYQDALEGKARTGN